MQDIRYNNVIIRQFDNHELLSWHCDYNDRIVIRLSGYGELQLENQLPIIIDKPCYIPKNHFHRLLNIKNLRVLIIEK